MEMCKCSRNWARKRKLWIRKLWIPFLCSTREAGGAELGPLGIVRDGEANRALLCNIARDSVVQKAGFKCLLKPRLSLLKGLGCFLIVIFWNWSLLLSTVLQNHTWKYRTTAVKNHGNQLIFPKPLIFSVLFGR